MNGDITSRYRCRMHRLNTVGNLGRRLPDPTSKAPCPLLPAKEVPSKHCLSMPQKKCRLLVCSSTASTLLFYMVLCRPSIAFASYSSPRAFPWLASHSWRPLCRLLRSLEACFRLQLHSSYARPAPKPTPTQAGHALRLKSRTEKTTPNPRPREDLMSMLERQRSHYFRVSASATRKGHKRNQNPMDVCAQRLPRTFSFKSASLTGLATAGGGGGTEVLDIFAYLRVPSVSVTTFPDPVVHTSSNWFNWAVAWGMESQFEARKS